MNAFLEISRKMASTRNMEESFEDFEQRFSREVADQFLEMVIVAPIDSPSFREELTGMLYKVFSDGRQYSRLSDSEKEKFREKTKSVIDLFRGKLYQLKPSNSLDVQTQEE